jgi:RNA polymerase sigma-70 factor (ECF subfamily)
VSLGPNFESILQAARVGAEWAWTAIYRDLAPSVLRYLRARGASDPEDLLGETFVKVVRSLASFEGGEAEFRAWIFTLARNGLIDEWRRDGRQPVEFLSSDALLAVCGDTPSAEACLLQKQAYERVSSVLSSLSEAQRDVVFLRVIAGLSIEECARVLGKRPGAVKSLQLRGLAAIRREMSPKAVSK